MGLYAYNAVINANTILFVSFLPLLMLYGDKGEFMKSMPTVVSMALLSALLVSNTFLPLISYYVLRGQKGFDEGGEECRSRRHREHGDEKERAGGAMWNSESLRQVGDLLTGHLHRVFILT